MSTVGVLFPPEVPREGLPDLVSDLERWNFDEVWFTEGEVSSDALALATDALSLTETLAVGAVLVAGGMTEPVSVATRIAALARARPGRLTVALIDDAGGSLHEAAGAQKQRLAALGEIVIAIRMLLTGQMVNVNGTFVALESVALDDPPAIVPEILLATASSKGIALAGRRADGLLLPRGCGPRFVDYARRHATRASCGPARPVLTVFSWFAIGDEREARARVAGAARRRLDAALSPRAVPDAAVAMRTDLDHFLPDDIATELAIAGPPHVCLEATYRLIEAGADRLVLVHPIERESRDQYALFAEHVLPQVQRRAR